MPCYSSGDFKKYFNVNMDALGLPVPTSLFDTYQAAVANATLMAGALSALGPGATMGELVGATTGLELLSVAAALSAVAYTGAVIGSIAIASGRSLGCGSSIADLFAFTHQNNLQFDGWHAFYIHNPQVMDKGNKTRKDFALRARNAPPSLEFA